MKILAIEKEIPGFLPKDFAPYLKKEALQVWQLHQAGVIREMYFRADEHSAVLMLECESVATAQTFLDILPLVQEELITFEIIPLAPYSGFERLFAKEIA
jgi:hypothetical protein